MLFNLELCPKGDDPTTPFTGHRTISITVRSPSYPLTEVSGHFRFTFNDQSFIFPPSPAGWTAEKCKQSFQGLKNLRSVSCSISATDVRKSVYTIKFLSFALWPYENNIYLNDGDPSLSHFSCDNSFLSQHDINNGITCALNDVITPNAIYPGPLTIYYHTIH